MILCQHEKWGKFDTVELTIMEALEYLADFVDESDPDAQFANSFHAYQTAEAIRAEYPEEDWFHLTGLIHDLGKVMGKYGQPQVLCRSQFHSFTVSYTQYNLYLCLHQLGITLW